MKELDVTPEYRGHELDEIIHGYSEEFDEKERVRFAEMLALVLCNYCFCIKKDSLAVMRSAQEELDSFLPVPI